MKRNMTICMHYCWKGQVADVSILSIFCWKESIINDLCLQDGEGSDDGFDDDDNLSDWNLSKFLFRYSYYI